MKVFIGLMEKTVNCGVGRSSQIRICRKGKERDEKRKEKDAFKQHWLFFFLGVEVNASS